jgi:hypothetical protein
MQFSENTSHNSTVGSTDTMTAQEIMAVARAEQDWRDGLSIDENPFPVGTSEYRHYKDEFERLLIQEEKLKLFAA